MTNFEVLYKKILNGEKIVLPIDGKVSFTVMDASGYTAEKMANDISKEFAKRCLEWANKEAE